MKKITPLFILASLPIIASAQITITSADLPTIYDAWIEYDDTTTHAAITPAGANQVWDYSTFAIAKTSEINLQPLTATDANWNANFPSTQMVHYNPVDSNAVYYSVNSTGIYLDGFYDNHSDAEINALKFQNSRLIVPTPFTYSDVRTNIAISTIEINQGLPIKMVSYTHTDFVCDAYGSITTPAGTFPNTIRIKETSYSYDSTFVDFGAGYQFYQETPPNDTTIHYRWIQNGSNSLVFLAEEQMNGSVGSGIIKEATYTILAPAMAPNPPTNLMVNPTLKLTVYDKMQLNWNDNSNNELGFNIERSIDSTNWSVITSVGPDVVSYLDMGLSPMTVYYYRVTAYNSIGTSLSSNTVSGNTDGTTSINDIEFKNEISAYPNPTKGTVNIQFKDIPTSNIEIYNIVGNRISSEQVNKLTYRIDLSNYSDGVYFIKINETTLKISKQ